MADITLLDGAMGSALRERGVGVPDYKTSIWSALALMEAPQEVLSLHSDYMRAGADVVTVNNYSVTPAILAREGLESQLAELVVGACKLAQCAREVESGAVKIAGSLPPLNTSYRADLVGCYGEIFPIYRTIASLLASHVDIFLCETMTTAAEAYAAAKAAAEYGKPIWVSWTLDEKSGSLRGGETIAEAVACLGNLPVEACLFNCSSTTAVTKALPALSQASGKRFGAYANPFRHEPSEDDQTSGSPDWLDADAYAEVAQAWIAAGATIVGGCCGTNPAYVRCLREKLKGS